AAILRQEFVLVSAGAPTETATQPADTDVTKPADANAAGVLERIAQTRRRGNVLRINLGSVGDPNKRLRIHYAGHLDIIESRQWQHFELWIKTDVLDSEIDYRIPFSQEWNRRRADRHRNHGMRRENRKVFHLPYRRRSDGSFRL